MVSHFALLASAGDPAESAVLDISRRARIALEAHLSVTTQVRLLHSTMYMAFCYIAECGGGAFVGEPSQPAKFMATATTIAQ